MYQKAVRYIFPFREYHIPDPVQTEDKENYLWVKRECVVEVWASHPDKDGVQCLGIVAIFVLSGYWYKQ